jgi:aldose 1-epimerase
LIRSQEFNFMSDPTITISHAASNTSATIAPQFGFNCYRWQAPIGGSPRDLLWYDPDFLVGKAKPTRSGIPLLFPFAGRIRGSQLSFDGKTYDIVDTLDDLGNPIHGFVLNRPWRIVEQTEDKLVGEFQPSVDAPNVLAKWPADYRLRVTYHVGPSSLSCKIEVHNPDDKLLPFGFGSHPYFRLPLGDQGSLANCQLTVPAHFVWQLDDQLLPTHQLHRAELAQAFERGETLGKSSLDNLLTGLQFEDRICHAHVDDPQNGQRLSVRFGSEFANCVVFIPPHREAVCIEPYTTAPDAFRLQTMGLNAHLRFLPPGGTWHGEIDMRLEKLPS